MQVSLLVSATSQVNEDDDGDNERNSQNGAQVGPMAGMMLICEHNGKTPNTGICSMVRAALPGRFIPAGKVGVGSLATPGGLEPPTNSLEGCCSILLSYGANLSAAVA